jgi:hypothetical protein
LLRLLAQGKSNLTWTLQIDTLVVALFGGAAFPTGNIERSRSVKLPPADGLKIHFGFRAGDIAVSVR